MCETFHVLWHYSLEPDNFTYDADGNLLGDGVWNYTWDAENRLIKMETVETRGESMPVQKLNFTYDYMGRRTTKGVLDLAGDNETYILTTFRQFIYDGWNIVAEADENSDLV